LASWSLVGHFESLTETMTHEVFVDLQRYLYAFRVRAIAKDGMHGAFSPATELYGERVEKTNTTKTEDVSKLDAREFTSESENVALDAHGRTKVLTIGSGIPLRKRDNMTFATLKTLKVSLELDVQQNFSMMHDWIHKALPSLRIAISKYLSSSALVSITSCELFLSSSIRKYASLEVFVIVSSESATSGLEYDNAVEQIFVALSGLQDSASVRLLEKFMLELRSHGVLVPEQLALLRPAGTSVHVQDMEFAVNVKGVRSSTTSEETVVCWKQLTGKCSKSYTLYVWVGSGVVVISILAICFLFRKTRQLSQVVQELKARKQKGLNNHDSQLHAKAMSDLEKQTEEVRNARDEIQRAKQVIQHKKQQIVKDKADLPPVEKTDEELGNIDNLPTLLETPVLSALCCGAGQETKKQGSSEAKLSREVQAYGLDEGALATAVEELVRDRARR